LQVLLYYNAWFSPCYVIATLLMFCYKAWELPYPSSTIGWEISFVCAYALVEAARLFEGWKGNLSETAGPMIVFLVFCLIAAGANMYFFQLQVFVLRLDQILNIVSLSFIGLEFLIGILAAVTFSRSAASLA
jgi:hypothetical protein